jgi:hypothetical protein
VRPLYENEQTLKAEKAVAEQLEKKWRCKLYKLPISYRADYLAIRDKPVAVIEIKCRGRKYPKMFLSLHKFLEAQALAEKLSVPFLLVYGFPEGVWWGNVTQYPLEIEVGGRTDRGDWQDTEPMQLFDLAGFKRL